MKMDNVVVMQQTYLRRVLMWTVMVFISLYTYDRSAFHASAEDDITRVLTIGGDVTETVYTLGKQEVLVGRDDTSYYPDSVFALPSVGYLRTLSSEGILSVKPQVIIASEEAGPPTVLKQLEGTGIPIITTKKAFGPQVVFENIRTVAEALNCKDKGEAVVEDLQAKYEILKTAQKDITDRPKILFLLSVQRGALLAGGKKTAADGMIQLAGGENAITEYEGYKPLSLEAAIAAKPNVILLPSHGVEALGGMEKIYTLPELVVTPAAKEKRVVAMDSLYLLGFGPRFVYAAAELCQIIHPAIELPDTLKNPGGSMQLEESGQEKGGNE